MFFNKILVKPLPGVETYVLLVDWLAGGLAGGLPGYLTGWLADWLVDWLATGWLAG